MTPTEPQHVALELERIRGGQELGFARVEGRLDLLVERGHQVDQRLAAGSARMDDLDDRITGVERRMWMLVGGITVVMSGAAGLAQLLGR